MIAPALGSCETDKTHIVTWQEAINLCDLKSLFLPLKTFKSKAASSVSMCSSEGVGELVSAVILVFCYEARIVTCSSPTSADSRSITENYSFWVDASSPGRARNGQNAKK